MSKGEITVGPGGEGAAGGVESKGLKGGALGLMSSVVVGMASTAPAYSLGPRWAWSWPAAEPCSPG